MDSFGIIKRPILTEKSSRLMEKENKYVFEVALDARKAFIKQAIRDLYGVTVIAINIAKTTPKGKKSWSGRKSAYTKPAFKKAIVQLKEGEILKIYEGGTEK